LGGWRTTEGKDMVKPQRKFRREVMKKRKVEENQLDKKHRGPLITEEISGTPSTNTQKKKSTKKSSHKKKELRNSPKRRFRKTRK